jgi:F-type H+-transporting ATPase subunit gamma
MGSLKFSEAELLGNDLTQVYFKEKLSKIIAFFNESKSIVRQRVAMRTILPLENLRQNRQKASFPVLCEPEKQLMLEPLATLYFRSQVFSLLSESYFSELAARLTSMDNASKNAQELIDELTLVLNNVRQGNITRELTEIVGAGKAIKQWA